MVQRDRYNFCMVGVTMNILGSMYNLLEDKPLAIPVRIQSWEDPSWLWTAPYKDWNLGLNQERR